MTWCGTGAVIIYWEGEDLLLVGPNSDWISYPFDDSIYIVAEIDGARIISNDLHELVQRVPGKYYIM